MTRALFLLLALAPLSSAADPAPVPPAIVPVPNGGTPTPQPPQPAPIPTSIRVTGERFELLMLTNAGTAPVTWDITTPTAFATPVVLFELKPGTVTDGWRMGATAPAQYTVGDAPTVKVYATGDGAATLAAWGVQAGKPVKLATFAILANKGPQPPPKPPEPDPIPVPPDPPGPAPDAALVTTFKLALDQDIAANRGSKAKAADLAVVFDSGAALLDLGDPAIAPRTVGDLYSKMFLSSVAKGIPRLPYLQATRAVVDANTPVMQGATVMTPDVKAQFQAAYRRIAAALTEASK